MKTTTDLAGAEDIVEVLEEGLALDFLIGEEESNSLILGTAGLPVQLLQILLQIRVAIGTRQQDLKRVVTANEGTQPGVVCDERLLKQGVVTRIHTPTKTYP